jgi:hypothetical protein
VELFAKLELVEHIKQNPTFVQLIFVVPEGMGESYKRQELICQDLHMIDWMTADVRRIPGIGPARQQKLNEKGIYTCSQLHGCEKDPELSLEFQLESVACIKVGFQKAFPVAEFDKKA